MNRVEDKEVPHTYEAEVHLLDLKLEGYGNIHSNLDPSRYQEYGSVLKECISDVSRDGNTACIDGRCAKCLANGQASPVRPRKAGGSVSPFAMKGIGDPYFTSSIVKSQAVTDQSADNLLFEQFPVLQRMIGRNESGHVSAMEDGEIVYDCGAANGLVKHVINVAELDQDSPAAKLTKLVLEADATTSPEQAENHVDSCIATAKVFATVLQKAGWNGQGYVQKVMDENPAGVEVLNAKRDENHGHEEDCIVIIDGPMDDYGPRYSLDEKKLKELIGGEAFVINLDELRRDAEKMATSLEDERNLLAASVLFHAGGVYKSLGDGSHPVFLIKISDN